MDKKKKAQLWANLLPHISLLVLWLAFPLFNLDIWISLGATLHLCSKWFFVYYLNKLEHPAEIPLGIGFVVIYFSYGDSLTSMLPFFLFVVGFLIEDTIWGIGLRIVFPYLDKSKN